MAHPEQNAVKSRHQACFNSLVIATARLADSNPSRDKLQGQCSPYENGDSVATFASYQINPKSDCKEH
jgi:hypothetical protein